MPNRLFCSRSDAGIRFAVVPSLEEAVSQLGRTARYPNDEEIVEFWALHGLHDKTVSQIGRTFGVSAQTASNWRRRAGGIPSVSEMRRQQRADAADAAEQTPAEAE